MSRRKQSNPKPLKREDVWGSDGEEGGGAGAARSPASAASGGTRGEEEEDESSSRIKMEVDIDIDETPLVSSPPPRLRLNTSLATDPAQRRDTQSSRDASSPEDGRARSEMELLPGPAFPSGSSASSPSSSGMFCLPQTPEPSPMQTVANGTVRVKQENLESTSPAPPPPAPRQVSNCYVCQPCGIRFSSLSTLEAHQTYYCSHRPSLIAAQTRSSSPSTPLPGSTKGESDGEVGSPRSGGPADDDSSAPAAKAPRTGRQYACPHCSYSADKKVSLNRHMRMHSAPCPPPSPAPTAPSDSETAEEGAVPLPPPPLDRYCSDCDIRFSSVKTYKAHKLNYCSTRHVVKPAAPSQTSSGAEDRAHTARGSSASSPAGSPPVGAQPFLALPTTPVLLVPYQLVQAASLISPHALPAGAAGHAPGACLLLLDGTVRPLTLPSPLQPAQETHPPPPPPPPRQLEQPQQQIQEAQSCASSRSPIPLDLSLPRSDSAQSAAPTSTPSPRLRVPDPEDEKENRVVNTSSPSLCSSPASSPSSASPRPPRQNGVLPGVSKKPDVGSDASSSPARKTPTSLPPQKLLKHPIMLPEMLGPLLGSHLAMLPASLLTGTVPISTSNHVAAAAPPQILVKQGVSRCAECNIVFCKMENYMAHKKHYCSARMRTDEASSPESGVATAKTASPSPNSVPAQAATTPPLVFPSKTLLQYICAACGIKFTSFDNLKAHQTHYCSKRDIVANITASTNNNEPPPEKRKCPKCKVVLPAEESASPHQCVLSTGAAVNSWRCPCCGVSSPTATAAQKHLEEAHAGVLRAFRCTICRYRGNTLRGMRTHIRMHFTETQKSQTEVREEDFISCVLAGEPEPKAAEEDPSSPEREEDGRKAIGCSERQHTCDQCNYSSNYKGNLVRHLKSVHHRNLESEDGGSPTPPPILSNVSTPSPEALVVKLEPSEEKISLTEDPPPPPGPSSVSSNSPTPPVDPSVTAGPRYCKSCDISFSYLSTFIAHKKFYCSSHHATPAAPVTSPPPSPASSPAAPTTPARVEASAHT